MSIFSVVNLWEHKVFASQCSPETHMALMLSTCSLLHNGNLVELLQKRKAVSA